METYRKIIYKGGVNLVENITYKNFIDNILKTRGRHGCIDMYYETHHIVPKCCGGSNDHDNLIDLYATEHFIAHKLLALENPNHSGLVYAWWNMSSCVREDRYKCTPEEYEEARIAFRQMMSESQMCENNSFYGKHHTNEARQKISEATKGENNPNYGKVMPDEVKQKISEANLGKVPSYETRIKLSEANSGENNPMYGKHHTEETKQKMRQAKVGKYNGDNNPMYGKHHSEDAKEKIRQAKIGIPDSDETRKKKSNSKLGAKNHKSKMVFCIELSQYFGSTGEAARMLNIQQSGISRCCSGKQEYAGKHPETGEELHWIYADKINNSLAA